MKTFAVSIAALFIWTACGDGNQPIIDREALVERNSPVVTAFDSLASLSVGNGEFAYTVDITGLQTFPDNYKKGVPLGTQSQWGWHSFANSDRLTSEETLKEYDFGIDALAARRCGLPAPRALSRRAGAAGEKDSFPT